MLKLVIAVDPSPHPKTFDLVGIAKRRSGENVRGLSHARNVSRFCNLENIKDPSLPVVSCLLRPPATHQLCRRAFFIDAFTEAINSMCQIFEYHDKYGEPDNAESGAQDRFEKLNALTTNSSTFQNSIIGKITTQKNETMVIPCDQLTNVLTAVGRLTMALKNASELLTKYDGRGSKKPVESEATRSIKEYLRRQGIAME